MKIHSRFITSHTLLFKDTNSFLFFVCVFVQTSTITLAFHTLTRIYYFVVLLSLIQHYPKIMHMSIIIRSLRLFLMPEAATLHI